MSSDKTRSVEHTKGMPSEITVAFPNTKAVHHLRFQPGYDTIEVRFEKLSGDTVETTCRAVRTEGVATPAPIPGSIYKGKWVRVQPQNRIYYYEGKRMVVTDVTFLFVSPSGTHYLETATGDKYIIPDGWVGLRLETEEWTYPAPPDRSSL